MNVYIIVVITMIPVSVITLLIKSKLCNDIITNKIASGSIVEDDFISLELTIFLEEIMVVKR